MELGSKLKLQQKFLSTKNSLKVYHLAVAPVHGVRTSSEVGARAQTRVSLWLRRIKWDKPPYVVSDTTTWVAEIRIFKPIFLGGKKERKRNTLSTLARIRPQTTEFDLAIEVISFKFGLLGISLKSLAKVQ